MNNWHKPSKEELKLIKRVDNKRLFRRGKTFFLFLILTIIIIYLATFASFTLRNNKENILTLIILTGIIAFTIIIFIVIYKLLFKHFYGTKKSIDEVNNNTKYLYHQMVSGVNAEEKLYAIVLKVDNEQIELLVDQKDYEVVNEETKILLGRYHDGVDYKYFIYY